MLRIFSRVYVFILPLAIVLWPGALQAKSIKVKPSSEHGSLTLSTNGAKGFVVFPKRAMKLNLVGPGKLKLVVRLNNTKKRKEFKGTLEIRAQGKRLLRSRLNLFMSRVGSYKENRSLHPSVPKTIVLNIPNGLQHLKISLKASRRSSMTVSLGYKSNADQSEAEDDDTIALVPLVSSKPKKRADDDMDLVPLVPLVPVKNDKKPVKVKPKVSNKDDAIASEDFELYDGQAKPKDHIKNTRVKIAPKPLKSAASVKIKTIKKPVKTKSRSSELTARNLKTAGNEKANEVSTGSHVKTKPSFSIGLNGGEISPFQAIGLSSPTGSLDIRYILPVFDGRLGIGLGVSYHRFKASIGYANSMTKSNLVMDSIPVSLQLFYRIPLDTVIEPFVGAGADLVIGLAELGSENSDTTTSDTAIGFGGHLSLGAEAAIGPGFVTLEVRGGVGVINLDLIKNLNPSGLSILAGYRLEI